MSAFDDHFDADLARVGNGIRSCGARVAEQLAKRGQVTAQATAYDDSISVVTLPGGLPCQIEIGTVALRLPPERLAAEILSALAAATRAAGARLRATVTAVVAHDVLDSLADLGVAPEEYNQEDLDG